MAVVGNVGTYAQVQPVQTPDFGGMVQNQFDRIDAEKKAAESTKAQAAKLAQEKLKDRRDPDAYKASGLAGYDESLSKVYKDFYNDATIAKQMYEQTGDSSYLYQYDNIVNEMNTITNEAASLKDYFTQAESLAKSGKLNEDNYKEVLFDLQQLKEGKAKYQYKDGRGFIQLYNEDGTEREPEYIGGFVKDNLNLVGDVDLNTEYKKVVDRVTAPLKESGSYYSNVKVRDINSPEAQPQREAIQLAANALSGDNAAMTKWYQSEVKPTTNKRKTGNWTDEEKKEASNYFYKNMINSYGKEVERGFGSPNAGGSGSGSGSDDMSKPTLFRKPGDIGQGYSWDGTGNKNPRINSMSVEVKGSNGKYENRIINDAVIKNIYMTEDAKGKKFIKMKYSTATGNASETYSPEEVDGFKAELNKIKNSLKEEDKKKSLELNKRIVSSQKQSEERFLDISLNSTQLIGNIANSMGFGSDQELIDDLTRIGFPKQSSIQGRISNYE